MIIQAQSKQEAIEIVMRENQLTQEDIKEIITVKPPNTKLFGMVKQLGTYEIVIHQLSESIEDIDEEISDIQKEFIEVVDGNIIVSNPHQREDLPMLFIHDPNIELFVNDEKISSQVVLQEEDNIKLIFHHIDPISNINVFISPNKMDGKITIVRDKGKHFYLPDIPKSHRCEIKTAYRDIDPEAISLDECVEVLDKYGVKKEFIDYDKLDVLLKSKDTSSEIVAKGRPLVESKDTQINYSTKLFESPLNSGIEPIVEIGEVIAEKISPALPGEDGINIMGENIKAKEVEDVNLNVEEGASLIEDGCKIISNIKGRPYLENGVVTVVPLFLVNGDFDNHMGTVNFDGDVIVKGNVLDEVHMNVTGSISISGSVYNSTFIAQKSIDIGGKAISCTIQAGADNSKFYSMTPYLENINNLIMKIFDEIKKIEGNNIKEKMNIVYQYKDEIEGIIKNITKITDEMKSEDLGFVIDHIAELRNSLLLVTMLKQEGFKKLLNFYNQIVEYISKIQSLADKDITVNLGYAQNSQISSSGDIIVTGKGTYQSNLISQNKIIYERSNSVVKGGTLIAEWEISAGTVGTPSEIYTECRVLKEGGQMNGHFYPGTVVIINNEKKAINTID